MKTEKIGKDEGTKDRDPVYACGFWKSNGGVFIFPTQRTSREEKIQDVLRAKSLG